MICDGSRIFIERIRILLGLLLTDFIDSSELVFLKVMMQSHKCFHKKLTKYLFLGVLSFLIQTTSAQAAFLPSASVNSFTHYRHHHHRHHHHNNNCHSNYSPFATIMTSTSTSTSTSLRQRRNPLQTLKTALSDEEATILISDKQQSNQDYKLHSKPAQKGDIVTIDFHLELQYPHDNNEATTTTTTTTTIEPLFDRTGKASFVLGYGNYVPELHELLLHQCKGDSLENKYIDAGWGDVNPNLIASLKVSDFVKTQPDKNIDTSSQLQIGQTMYLKSGVSCRITDRNETHFTIDANPLLAGVKYKCDLEILNVESAPASFLNNNNNQININIYNENENENKNDKYQVATLALGCFWGGELAFMRLPGVVGTKVGYTQGTTLNPSYKEVCAGTTGHTEAIMIVYDSTILTYESLVNIGLDRLGDDVYLWEQVGNDKGNQYRHGIYYHNEEQKQIAEKCLKRKGQGVKTECKAAVEFYDAEDYHQQYLLKGGQSAKKGATEYIRCYG